MSNHKIGDLPLDDHDFVDEAINMLMDTYGLPYEDAENIYWENQKKIEDRCKPTKEEIENLTGGRE